MSVQTHTHTHTHHQCQVSETRGCAEEEVEKEVRAILGEMGHAMFLPSVRLLALVLRPFVRSAIRGIYVNRTGLEQVC